MNSFPVLFLIVGLSVLFLRVEDRDAWLMMLVFATASLLPACPTSLPAPPGALRSNLLLQAHLESERIFVGKNFWVDICENSVVPSQRM